MDCIEAMTPSWAKRGMSPGARCWACSMRQRSERAAGSAAKIRWNRSSVSWLARSPMAWTETWKPSLAAISAIWRMVSMGVTFLPVMASVPVGLQEPGAAGAERAVAGDLADAADGEMVVGVADQLVRGQLGGQGRDRLAVDVGVEPQRERTRLGLEPIHGGEALAHVHEGGDAL